MEPDHGDPSCGPQIFTSSPGIIKATELSLGWNQGGSFSILEISLKEGAVPMLGHPPTPSSTTTPRLDDDRQILISRGYQGSSHKWLCSKVLFCATKGVNLMFCGNKTG